MRSFKEVLEATGRLEDGVAHDQHKTRHHSETLSRRIAKWIGGLLGADRRIARVLPPEGKVDTCYGKKSLDVGCLDEDGCLTLDISIKTFNFRDRSSRRYSHNYTGRFYELLGEGLDLRLSYPESVLSALIFIPIDSCDDAKPGHHSSFGHLVKQFSKLAGKGTPSEHALSFEGVFVGLWDRPSGEVAFFDAGQRPPRSGRPEQSTLIPIEVVLEQLLKIVEDRSHGSKPRSKNVTPLFRWAD